MGTSINSSVLDDLDRRHAERPKENSNLSKLEWTAEPCKR